MSSFKSVTSFTSLLVGYFVGLASKVVFSLFDTFSGVKPKEFCLLFKAVCVAFEIGLSISLVLSTLLKPTSPLVVPWGFVPSSKLIPNDLLLEKE